MYISLTRRGRALSVVFLKTVMWSGVIVLGTGGIITAGRAANSGWQWLINLPSPRPVSSIPASNWRYNPPAVVRNPAPAIAQEAHYVRYSVKENDFNSIDRQPQILAAYRLPRPSPSSRSDNYFIIRTYDPLGLFQPPRPRPVPQERRRNSR